MIETGMVCRISLLTLRTLAMMVKGRTRPRLTARSWIPTGGIGGLALELTGLVLLKAPLTRSTSRATTRKCRSTNSSTILQAPAGSRQLWRVWRHWSDLLDQLSAMSTPWQIALSPKTGGGGAGASRLVTVCTSAWYVCPAPIQICYESCDWGVTHPPSLPNKACHDKSRIHMWPHMIP